MFAGPRERALLGALAFSSLLACSSTQGDDTTGFGSGGGGGADGGGSQGPVDSSLPFTSDSASSFLGGDSTTLGSGTCQTGVYDGTFSCYYYQGVDAGIGNAPDSGGIGPITGTMSFTLMQKLTSTGELTNTDVASGTFNATTGGFIAAAADLTGLLDCGSGKFTGQLVNGIYGFNLGGQPVPDPNNKFQGPLASDYNGTTFTFVNGQWSMSIANMGACIGTWTAKYSGPGDAGVADATGQ